MEITMAEYRSLCAERAAAVKALAEKALDGQLPAGYMMSDDPAQMYANALFRVKPAVPKPGDRSFHIHHSMHYRQLRFVDASTTLVSPTQEFVWISCDLFTDGSQVSDESFGNGGRVTAQVCAGDIASAVREAVSIMETFAPFTRLEWRRSDHDPQKYELFDDDSRKLQSVWKSGSTWGTLIGICCSTLAKAKAQAEAAARFTIRSRHAERLSSL